MDITVQPLLPLIVVAQHIGGWGSPRHFLCGIIKIGHATSEQNWMQIYENA